jgi:hypothetical protein
VAVSRLHQGVPWHWWCWHVLKEGRWRTLRARCGDCTPPGGVSSGRSASRVLAPARSLAGAGAGRSLAASGGHGVRPAARASADGSGRLEDQCVLACRQPHAAGPGLDLEAR